MNVHAFTEWLHAQDPVTFLPDEVLVFFWSLVKQVKVAFFLARAGKTSEVACSRSIYRYIDICLSRYALESK